nr:complement factor D [Columba livia]
MTPPALRALWGGQSPTSCVCSRDGKVFQVLLGAHSLTQPEPHKRLYRVRAQIPHPGSNIHNNKDDLLLLQVGSELPGPPSLPRARHSPAPANPSVPGTLGVTDQGGRKRSRPGRDHLAPQTLLPHPLGPSLLLPPNTLGCRSPPAPPGAAGQGKALSPAQAGLVQPHRPDKLQEVKRPVISRDLCNERTRHDHTITHKMMCTDSRRKDSCKGDSAGGAQPIL